MKRKILITLCALVVGTWVLGANRIQVSTDPVGVVQEEATEAQEIIEVAVEPEREMQFIYVDVENADLEVFAGESIDLKSMPMYVKYSDETVKKLDTDLVTFSAIDTTEYGEKAVTATYEELETVFIVNVTFAVKDCEQKTMYSTTSLNVRKGPTTDYESVGTLEVNEAVKVTGVCDNGWSRIEYGESVGYTSTKYLSDTKVEIAPPIDASGITWIGNVSSDCRNKAISLWGKVPQNVKNALSATGCQVIVTTDPAYTDGHAGMYWPFASGQNYCAIYAGSVGKVNMAVIHEIGHFVDDYVGRKTGTGSYLAMSHTAEFQQIYAEEVGRSGYPSWATDCVEDYFAEAFWKCCVSPTATQSNLPRTYEYVMRVANMC